MQAVDTRICAKCGQVKPLIQFDARFIHKNTRLLCAQCRGWKDGATVYEEQKEQLRLRREEWEHKAGAALYLTREPKPLALSTTEIERCNELSTVLQQNLLVGFTDFKLPIEIGEQTIDFMLGNLPEEWLREWNYYINISSESAKNRQKILLTKIRLWILHWYQHQLDFQTYRSKREQTIADFAAIEGITHDQAIAALFCRLSVDNWDKEKWRSIDTSVYPLIEVTSKKRPGLPETIRKEVIQEAQGICTYCGTYTLDYHIDHRIPRKRGGLDNKENLAYACEACNSAKQWATDKEFLDFLAHRTSPEDRMTMNPKNPVGVLRRLETAGFDIPALLRKASKATWPEYPDYLDTDAIFGLRWKAPLPETEYRFQQYERLNSEIPTEVHAQIYTGSGEFYTDYCRAHYADGTIRPMSIEDLKQNYPAQYPAFSAQLEIEFAAGKLEWEEARARVARLKARKMERARHFMES